MPQDVPPEDVPPEDVPPKGAWAPTPRQVVAYAMGGCADLALALQRRLGWPMMAIMEPDTEGNRRDGADNDRPVHVVLKSPDGLLLDIMGLRRLPEVEQWAVQFLDDPAVMESWWTTDWVDAAMIRAWIADGYLDQPTQADRQQANATAASMVKALGLSAAATPPKPSQEATEQAETGGFRPR